jgi:branched-chain amino acid transport system permease protein
MAMREDEDVAQAMGVRLVPTKLLAFASGAAMAGLAGAVFASKVGSVYPHSFNLLVSINVLAVVIVGGMGSNRGVIAGALVLFGLPELLREFSEYRYFVFGAMLIAMMLLKPEGLIPDVAHRRELHAAEGPQRPPEAAQVAAGD